MKRVNLAIGPAVQIQVSEPPGPPTPNLPGGGLVLVVDDELDGRVLVTTLLSQVGFDVVSAASGEEALEVATEKSPDLVVLDVMLPGIDGFETCRRLKQQQGSSLPVLMLSARGGRAVIEGLEAGADDYLPKPFDVGEFWARVEALRRIRAAEAAARRRAERLLSLQRLSAAVAARLDETELLQLVLAESRHLLNVSGAVLYLWDAQERLLRPAHLDMVPSGVAPTARRAGEGVAGQAFAERKPVWVADYAAWSGARREGRQMGIRAAVAAPLLLGDEAMGAIAAWKLEPDTRIDEEDAQLLGLLASQAAAALNNVRLYAAQRDAARRAAERAAQLEALMESLVDGVLMVDAAGLITSANRAAAELLGVAHERLLGARCDQAMPRLSSLGGRPIPTKDLPLVAVLNHGAASVNRELIAEVGGRERILIDTTTPLRDSSGALAGAVSVFRDVTERRQAEERQVEADKLRALGQMASGVAHNVNNLLATVLGRAELARIELERGGLDDRRLGEALRLIEQAAEDGAQTVRRIQEFARVRRDADVAVVDLSSIVRGAVELTRPQWRDAAQVAGRTIEVSLELEDGLLVSGQAAELREVLTNLLLNAIDAMPRGGQVSILGRQVGQRIRLEVVDTGVGMSAEVRRRVFEPFFTTKTEAGTGLGLAVSYGIVQRRGGQISVESTPMQGTKFVLEFPPAVESSPGPRTVAEPPASSRRILVVDDEPALASVLRRLLESEGHQVTSCTSGAQALELFDPAQHELVMTDFGMPDLNGLQLATALHDRSPDTPIILVTGWGNELDPEEPPRGIARVLAKPYRLASVLEAVTDALAVKPAPKGPASG